VRYLRYESAAPNALGAHPGIFGLANGLARSGRLWAADGAWWGATHDWYDAAYRDPAIVDPTLFDKARHPWATCWFRASAEHLLCRVPGYLALLERYGIGWRERPQRRPRPDPLRRRRPDRGHPVPAGSACRVPRRPPRLAAPVGGGPGRHSKHPDNALGVLDVVQDAVGAAPRAEGAAEVIPQRLADAARVCCEPVQELDIAGTTRRGVASSSRIADAVSNTVQGVSAGT
jgi:hypothetical protein